MTAKFFADSNVVLYTIRKHVRKADIARGLLAEHQAASVVNECVSALVKKGLIPYLEGLRNTSKNSNTQ